MPVDDQSHHDNVSSEDSDDDDDEEGVCLMFISSVCTNLNKQGCLSNLLLMGAGPL